MSVQMGDCCGCGGAALNWGYMRAEKRFTGIAPFVLVTADMMLGSGGYAPGVWPSTWTIGASAAIWDFNNAIGAAMAIPAPFETMADQRNHTHYLVATAHNSMWTVLAWSATHTEDAGDFWYWVVNNTASTIEVYDRRDGAKIYSYTSTNYWAEVYDGFDPVLGDVYHKEARYGYFVDRMGPDGVWLPREWSSDQYRLDWSDGLPTHWANPGTWSGIDGMGKQDPFETVTTTTTAATYTRGATALMPQFGAPPLERVLTETFTTSMMMPYTLEQCVTDAQAMVHAFDWDGSYWTPGVPVYVGDPGCNDASMRYHKIADGALCSGTPGGWVVRWKRGYDKSPTPGLGLPLVCSWGDPYCWLELSGENQLVFPGSLACDCKGCEVGIERRCESFGPGGMGPGDQQPLVRYSHIYYADNVAALAAGTVYGYEQAMMTPGSWSSGVGVTGGSESSDASSPTTMSASFITSRHVDPETWIYSYGTFYLLWT